MDPYPLDWESTEIYRVEDVDEQYWSQVGDTDARVETEFMIYINGVEGTMTQKSIEFAKKVNSLID